MEKFKLNINGKEVKGLPGQTILEVARENDIFIPTLCYDERTKILRHLHVRGGRQSETVQGMCDGNRSGHGDPYKY